MPFLFSAVMVIIGLWVRLRLVESETFVKAEEKGAIRKFPLGTVLRRHWWHLILGTFIMLATYVLFYLMTNFTLSYGTKAADLQTASAAAEAAAEAAGKPFDATAFAAQFYPGLGFGYTDFVIMQIIGVVFFGIFTLLSGPIADRIGRRKLLLWVTGLIIVFGLTFNLFLLPQADPKFTGALTQAFLIFGFVLMGATFGPMGAVLPELFPTNVRYTGSAVSYNVSSILGAALAPDRRGRAVGRLGREPVARRDLPLGDGRAHLHRPAPGTRDEGRRLRRRPGRRAWAQGRPDRSDPASIRPARQDGRRDRGRMTGCEQKNGDVQDDGCRTRVPVRHPAHLRSPARGIRTRAIRDRHAQDAATAMTSQDAATAAPTAAAVGRTPRPAGRPLSRGTARAGASS